MEISQNGVPGEHAVRRVGMEPRFACGTAQIPHRRSADETAWDQEMNHVRVIPGYVQVSGIKIFYDESVVEELN